MTTFPVRFFPRVSALVLLSAAVLPRFASAVELGSESFEGSSGYLASFFSDGSADYCERVQVSGAGGDSTPIGFGSANGTPITGHDGNWVIVSEDVDDALNPLGDAGPAIIRLDDIDVAGYSNLQVTVRLATNTAYNTSWELDDNIRIEYAFDGSSGGIVGNANPTLLNGSYSVAGRINGSNRLTGAASGFGIGPIIDDNENGVWDVSEITQVPVNGAMQDFTFDIPGTGTAISVQLVINQFGGSEELAVDYIRVTGDVAATNAPVIAGIEGAAASWTEGGSATQVSGAITVTDSDSDVVGATVSIQSGFQSGEDLLAVSGTLPPGISAAYASGILTLSGNGSPAEYQNALRQITYSNSSANPNLFQTRTIRFQVNDGTTSSNTLSRNLMLTGFVASATIPYVEDFNTEGNGLRYTSNSFTDGQVIPQDYFERTNSNPHPGHLVGAYQFNPPQGGGYFASEDVDSPANPLGPGQAAIVRLPDLVATGLGNFQVTVYLADHNNGSNIDGGELIEVQAAFDGNSGATALGSGNYVTFGRFVGDADSMTMRQDTNLDGSSSDPADQTSPSLTSTMTPYTFSILGAGNLLSVQIAISNTAGSEELAFDHILVTGTPTGPPPVLANIETTPAGFTEGDPPLQVSNTITATDADDTELESATIQITGGYQAGEDILALSGALPAAITSVAFNPLDGSISLAGTASLADYDAALRQVTYENTKLINPEPGDRTITFQVRDATSGSNIAARTIAVIGVVEPSVAPYLEDFDTDGEGVRYTSNTFTDGQLTPQDYFERSSANPHPAQLANGALVFTAPQDGGYWTSEDVDAPENQLGDHGIVRLRDLDLTGLENRELSIFLAANGSGFDTTEKIEIQYAYDLAVGGTDLTAGSYTTLARFINHSGSLRQDSDLDGSSTDPEDAGSPELNGTMTKYAFSLPDAGNLLSVQVKVTGTSGNENISFDHLFIDATQITETVVTADDSGPGSLRQTIADIPANGIIVFDPALSGETLSLSTGQLLIDKNLTIDGSALERGITISAGGLSRVFQINSGASVSMTKLTIADGTTGGLGGGISSNGHLEVRDCAMLRNKSLGGGAIASTGTGASLEVVNSTITANSALFAGAILSRDGAFELVHSTVSDNVGTGGTGALVLERGTATIENSIVAGNRGTASSDFGGISTVVTAVGANLIGSNQSNYSAVFPADGILIGTAAAPVAPVLSTFGLYGGGTGTMHPLAGSPAFDNAIETGNTPASDQRGLPRNVGGAPDLGAVEGGPAVMVTTASDSGPGSLRQVMLEAAATSGTRIYFDGGVFPAPITLASQIAISASTHCFIDASDIPGGVTVSGGGGVRIFNLTIPTSNIGMQNLTLTGGNANPGGAIHNFGTLTLNRVNLVGNTSTGRGGAMYNFTSGILNLTDSSLSENTAQDVGGAITNEGTLTLTNTTLSGNSTDGSAGQGFGGAIFNFDVPLRLIHCTVTGNTASTLGGGIRPQNGSITIENSIIAGNSAASGADLYANVATVIVGRGTNLIGDNSTVSGAFPASPLVGTIASPIAPRLAPLGNYGGFTPSHPPLADSPALNAALALASSPFRDQRGQVRTAGGAPDLGAAELALLFENAGPILVNDTDVLLPSTASRDNTAGGTLFFRFTVDPLSNFTTENYFAAFQLFEDGTERLAIGNDFGPWAYSAFNTTSGFVDLNSSNPESGAPYEFVRAGVRRTIVFRVDYVPGDVDLVSVWLEPDLSLPEFAQQAVLLTTFTADASFDELRLREGNLGAGDGWTFSNLAVSELSPFGQPVTFAQLYPGLDPDGDANGDGLSNYLHYASGDNPSLPVLVPSISGDLYTHTARIDGSDVFFSGYEFSTDLSGFAPMVEGLHYRVLSTSKLTQGVNETTIQVLFDPLDDPKVFWRHGFSNAR